jgi:hypothetical protein
MMYMHMLNCLPSNPFGVLKANVDKDIIFKYNGDY